MTKENNFKVARDLIKDIKNDTSISDNILNREDTRYALAIILVDAGFSGKNKYINELTANSFRLGMLLGMKLLTTRPDTNPEDKSEDELVKICLDCDHLKMKNGALQCSVDDCKNKVALGVS